VEPPAATPKYQVELPEFEGPLDLLLHLVKRHELDVFDIPISFVTEKYLEYLKLMQDLNLDVAGEYLLMAATLCHIKSRELLPTQDEDEEEGLDEDGPDPKEELIRRLLEYQKYKEAAEDLSGRPALGRQIFRRGVAMEMVDPMEQPLAEVSVFALIEAFSKVLQRTNVHMVHDVVIDRISISDRINSIVDMLAEKESLRFEECFSFEGGAAQVRHELVVTFLSLLEMAKLKMIRIIQRDEEGEIYLSRTEALHSVDKVEEFD
jgi:segregation and condensation protein A